MSKKIEESLRILDEQLETLWRTYLSVRPCKWLWELEHTRAELVEARGLYDVICDLRGRVYIMRSIVNDSAQLNPVRTDGPL